jgi:drug/metabolite transporter (DMT)-like permease
MKIFYWLQVELAPMNQNPTTSIHTSRGYFIALVSAVILSTTAILIRHLSINYKLPALVLAFWRDSFVAVTLLLILGITRPAGLRVQKRDLLYFLIYGFVLAIFNSLWTNSVVLNGAAVSTVLVYSSAAFTALLGWWLLKESLGWVKLLAVAMSLGGCVLVAGAYDPGVWQSNLLAIFTGVISGLAYAAYSLMGRTAANRGLNAWTTIMYTFAFAACFLLLFNLVSGGRLPGTATRPEGIFWLGNAWAGWGVLFLLAAGPTVAGFGLYNVSLGYLPSSVANLILSTEPVFTAVIAYVLLGEQMTGIQVAGSLMILGGVLLMRLFAKEPDSESEPAGI